MPTLNKTIDELKDLVGGGVDPGVYSLIEEIHGVVDNLTVQAADVTDPENLDFSNMKTAATAVGDLVTAGTGTLRTVQVKVS